MATTRRLLITCDTTGCPATVHTPIPLLTEAEIPTWAATHAGWHRSNGRDFCPTHHAAEARLDAVYAAITRHWPTRPPLENS